MKDPFNNLLEDKNTQIKNLNKELTLKIIEYNSLLDKCNEYRETVISLEKTIKEFNFPSMDSVVKIVNDCPACIVADDTYCLDCLNININNPYIIDELEKMNYEKTTG